MKLTKKKCPINYAEKSLKYEEITQEEAQEWVDYLCHTVLEVPTVNAIICESPTDLEQALAWYDYPLTLREQGSVNFHHWSAGEFNIATASNILSLQRSFRKMTMLNADYGINNLGIEILLHITLNKMFRWRYFTLSTMIKLYKHGTEYIPLNAYKPSWSNFIASLQFKEKEDIERQAWILKATKFAYVVPTTVGCFICKKPAHVRLKDNRLHADGKAAVEWIDGTCDYFLNGVLVPDWLAKTPASELNLNQFFGLSNVSVRDQFIKKYGIERTVQLGEEIDSWENHANAYNFEWYKKSEYKLIDMSKLFPGVRYMPYLYMKNQTVPGTYHLECVFNPNSKRQPRTIIQGLKVRLNGVNPEKLEITAIA